MDFLAFINTYQYSLVPALIAFIAIATTAIYLGIIFWVARDVTTRTKNILAIAGAIILVTILNFIGLIFYLLIRPITTLTDTTAYNDRAGIDNPNLINCINCRETIRHEFNNCPFCGIQQNLICPDCGVRHNPTWLYCENCGHNFTKVKKRSFKIILPGIKSVLNLPSNIVRNINSLPKPRLKLLSKISLPKLSLPRFKKSIVTTSAGTQIESIISTPKVKAKKDTKSKSKIKKDDESKPIKLNKDGTPRKPRSDAGRERGNYKPRQ